MPSLPDSEKKPSIPAPSEPDLAAVRHGQKWKNEKSQRASACRSCQAQVEAPRFQVGRGTGVWLQRDAAQDGQLVKLPYLPE